MQAQNTFTAQGAVDGRMAEIVARHERAVDRMVEKLEAREAMRAMMAEIGRQLAVEREVELAWRSVVALRGAR